MIPKCALIHENKTYVSKVHGSIRRVQLSWMCVNIEYWSQSFHETQDIQFHMNVTSEKVCKIGGQ